MKVVHYCPEGQAVSDFELQQWIDAMLYSEQEHHYVSTWIVIDALRVRIKHGLRILIVANGVLFEVDENGRSADWRKCNVETPYDTFLLQLI